MQANKDQDWTDDAAFWDEAWADMNTRLDTEPARRKGGLAWWFLYLGVAMAGLFVLVVGAGVIFYPEQTVTTPSVPSVIASDPVDNNNNVTDVGAVATTDATGAGTNEASDHRPATAKAKKSAGATGVGVNEASGKQPTVQAKKSHLALLPQTDQLKVEATVQAKQTEPAQNQQEEASSRLVNRFKTADLDDERKLDQTSQLTDAPTSEVALQPTGNLQISLEDKGNRDKKAASIQVASLAIPRLTENMEYAIPAVPLQRHRFSNPLTLEGGLSSSFGVKAPGYYAGLGYRINGGRKLSFPLSLRYRFDEFQKQRYPGDDSMLTNVPTGDPVSENNNEVLEFQSISAATLEFRMGLAFEVAPRLRLTTGLSAGYQLRALVNFEGQSTTGFSLDADLINDYSVRLSRGEALLMELSQNGVSPDFNRWSFRANMGVTYDLTPRLGLKFNATHLLNQPDRAGVIGLQSGRMELGLNYRLK